MPWHKTDTKLRNHPKLIVTAVDLEIRPVYLLGHLEMMWLGALDSYEDGDLSRLDNAMIASLADWNIKTADRFVQALTERGWLEDNRIHDWLDFAGDYLVKKYKSSNRAKLVEIWAKHGRVYGAGNRAKQSDTSYLLPKGSIQEVGELPKGSKQEALDIDIETTKYVCDRAESSTATFEGQFDPRRTVILDAWKERMKKAGLEVAISQRDKTAASNALLAIDAGEFSKDQLFTAMDNLMDDPEWRHRYSLHGFINDLPRWLNRKKDDAYNNPPNTGSRKGTYGTTRSREPPKGKYAHIDAANFE